MANLIFDFRNYSFNRALDILIGGFSGSFAAMNEQLQAAHDAMVRHDQFLADGGDDGAVYEEEDGPVRAFLYDTAMLLDSEHTDATLSARAIREAFVISIFHLWEKSARSWVKCHEQGFERLTKALRKGGIPLHQKMATVNDLSNFLKHDNKSDEKRIRRCLRDYIRGPQLYVVLSDSHLGDIISYVRYSCPPAQEYEVGNRT